MQIRTPPCVCLPIGYEEEQERNGEDAYQSYVREMPTVTWESELVGPHRPHEP